MDSELYPKFEKFCRAEMATGGPDPQIPTILDVVKHNPRSPFDSVWMAGCYGAHHCVPSAVIVYQNWTPEQVLNEPWRFQDWLKMNWDYLPVRPEMRSHRMLIKRQACLASFAKFALDSKTWYPIDDFEVLWYYTLQQIWYFGRYMAIKFFEIGRQAGFIKMALPDLRAKGGWSPRRALAMMYPHIKILGVRSDESPATIKQVEESAKYTIECLANNGVNVNYFQLQVMLCEFKEALYGTYYPGASLDEELEFIRKVETVFPMTVVRESRLRCFNQKYLGEVMGWPGTRKEMYKEWR